MKYCKECGAPLKDSALYCYACGTPYGETADPDVKNGQTGYKKKDRKYRYVRSGKRSHTGLKVFLTVLLIIICAALVYVLYSPALRTIRLVRSDNLDGAEAVYDATVKDNGFESFVLRVCAAPVSDLILRDYNRDTVSYSRAKEELEMLQKVEDPANEVVFRIDQLENLKESKKSYAAGISAEQKGDYAAAMTGYAGVIEEDEHYDTAQTKAKSMAEKYKSEILSSASDLTTETEYENAIQTLTAAQKALPNDQDFSEALSTLKQKYSSLIKSRTTEVAKDYISKGYYKQAIDLLNKALTYSENDMELQSLLTTATTDYEEFVKDQLEIYQENKDYDGAMALLERVREDLPDDAVIDQMYETAKASEDLYQ